MGDGESADHKRRTSFIDRERKTIRATERERERESEGEERERRGTSGTSRVKDTAALAATMTARVTRQS